MTDRMNEGERFAERWISAWNSMELEQALALWADDMVFTSPLAAELTGSPTLQGKSAASAYWGRALAEGKRLHFELVEALWDVQRRAVTIVYRRRRGEDLRLAAEIIHLNAEGIGVRGTALHGPSLER